MARPRRGGYLFREYDLHAVQENQRAQMTADIDGADGETIRATPVDDLVERFVSRYRLDVPN